MTEPAHKAPAETACRARGGGPSFAAGERRGRRRRRRSRAPRPGTGTAARRDRRGRRRTAPGRPACCPPVPFHGKYQAGILPQPQRQTAVISFNVTADGRDELTDLFQTLTARARFLTAGGTPPQAGIGGPPSDSGVLGPTVTPTA